ncbi:hypothetical protein EJB05_06830, partial [Eragrostis curvula]
MVDVRVVIRRHFPVRGPGGTQIVVEKVAEDIALRRRQSRQLRQPERVDRALAMDVLPLQVSNKPAPHVVCAPPKSIVDVKAADPCMMSFESAVPAEKPKLKPVGVIGDNRPKPAAEEMFKGWVPW